ncbi:MAG TPA: hypothetical protein EYN66_01730 [Myxococcales bacterium]|nr:hypothetical protein [Myxococcales bacterium]
MKARYLLSALLLSGCFFTTNVAAKEGASTVLDNFGGSVTLSNSVGRGSFLGNEFNARPYWNMAISLSPKYTISKEHKLTTSLNIGFNTNLVDNADTSTMTPQETNLSDISMSLSWGSFVDIKKGLFKLSTYARVYFPTSKVSQFSNRILATRVSLSATSKPLSWLSVGYQFSPTKFFSKYTNKVLDLSEFDFPVPSRAGGAEALGSEQLALGSQVSSFSLSHHTWTSFSFLKKFNAGVYFYYI